MPTPEGSAPNSERKPAERTETNIHEQHIDSSQNPLESSTSHGHGDGQGHDGKANEEQERPRPLIVDGSVGLRRGKLNPMAPPFQSRQHYPQERPSEVFSDPMIPSGLDTQSSHSSGIFMPTPIRPLPSSVFESPSFNPIPLTPFHSGGYTVGASQQQFLTEHYLPPASSSVTSHPFSSGRWSFESTPGALRHPGDSTVSTGQPAAPSPRQLLAQQFSPRRTDTIHPSSLDHRSFDPVPSTLRHSLGSTVSRDEWPDPPQQQLSTEPSLLSVGVGPSETAHTSPFAGSSSYPRPVSVSPSETAHHSPSAGLSSYPRPVSVSPSETAHHSPSAGLNPYPRPASVNPSETANPSPSTGSKRPCGRTTDQETEREKNKDKRQSC